MDLNREWHIRSENGEQKCLKLIQGDLTELQGPCDIVVCSAYRKEYFPTRSSFLFSLMNRGYYVWELAEHPEDGLSFPDGWISRDTGMDYRRIACIELMDLDRDDPESEEALLTILKKSFSTLRYMLEQAAYSGIPVRKLAMIIPGTGFQGIRLCYILAPMIAHCRSLMESDIVDEISVYTLNQAEAEEAAGAFEQAFGGQRSGSPDVFISYSSRQRETAHEICRCVRDAGVECWIAPESIPEGSSYQAMIPEAISSVKIVLLILTPDAVRSRWVQKEIGSAVGAGKIILPYQMTAFDLGRQFTFLLDGEQIMFHRENGASGRPYQELTDRILYYLTL